ncbi:MAG: hypothetical protein A2V70_06245 [Planctomycetes bacterium RBG_13_63_9]|nr:MAG: hypothetical protein A2V70_06245 [Planctomycetes bacterium RBG_13_63_9]
MFYDGTPRTQVIRGELALRLERTAFDRVIRERQDVRALFNHDPNMVLGRTSAGTLRLAIDRLGLRYEIDLDLENSLGRDVARWTARRDLQGSSMGFQIAATGDRWEKSGGLWVRWINELSELFDVGPVTFPANEATDAYVIGGQKQSRTTDGDALTTRQPSRARRASVAALRRQLQKRQSAAPIDESAVWLLRENARRRARGLPALSATNPVRQLRRELEGAQP